MTDIDTQIIPSASSAKDSIQSFSSIVGAARQEAGTVQADSVIEQEQIDTANVGTLECECSVTVSLSLVFILYAVSTASFAGRRLRFLYV